MYISKIEIKNFRCFDNCDKNIVEFNEGLNVIIGENNAGKTTILKALQLIFDTDNKNGLNIDDFNKSIIDFTEPPEIIIQATITSSKSDRDIDKALVATWLTKLESPWEAQLTYEYFLPEDKKDDYKEEIAAISKDDKYIKNAFNILEKYLNFYKSKIFGGNPDANVIAEREWLSKFDFQFLGPLRDAESEIYSGKKPLLKSLLKKSLEEYQKTKPDDCVKNQKNLKDISEKLVDALNKSQKFEALKEFTQKTGASTHDNNIPKIKGLLEEKDIIDALKLLIKKTGFEIPITLNGLGYNNLLYISLILTNFDDELNNNEGSVYPILLIEEPEAHLHPSLQYNFMNYIHNKHKTAKQIFITSHSTHITSAVPLDNIICMSEINDKVTSIRPGLIFDKEIPDDIKSKKYIERYLDATKSNLLFAKGIIFVEGMTEQILIPCLADYIQDSIMEETLTTTIRVDGSCFKHFLKLFDSGRENTLTNKRVSCIMDTDPSRKMIEGKRFESCFPFELELEPKKYEYRKISPIISNLKAEFGLNEDYENQNIKVCINENGKTFEYDFALDNPGLDLLIVDSCVNKDKLGKILDYCITKKDSIKEIIKKFKIHEGITEENWLINENKIKECFAYYYLHCVKENKGEAAFDLENNLRENLKLKNGEDPASFKELIISEHIEKAINWACKRG